eukprot:11665080-Alexandrium_andersonii.AAC.1
MSASLVGSEMCIRDRTPHHDPPDSHVPVPWSYESPSTERLGRMGHTTACLLYTSDAADDM